MKRWTNEKVQPVLCSILNSENFNKHTAQNMHRQLKLFELVRQQLNMLLGLFTVSATEKKIT